ncbi:hypothetical protein NC99_15830 [Sunxiuqinia dokdonensis]|uniref:Uncharacterized protein n=1 Tax=Sunxiuqinia dokdonensis TaxID=1409788 RepID=A0A0L8VB57_9BACT|nr:hypothetical protein NC99_15830 [Sunxiuqinia dokdonensis]
MVFFLFLPVFSFVFEKNITVQNTTIQTVPEGGKTPPTLSRLKAGQIHSK